MIGLVLVTHGALGEALLAALHDAVGRQAQTASIGVGPDDNMDSRRQDIATAIALCDDGDGVILASDLFGGTPSNLALSLMDLPRIDCIAGVNLAALLAFTLHRHESVQDCIVGMKHGGRASVRQGPARNKITKGDKAQFDGKLAASDALRRLGIDLLRLSTSVRSVANSPRYGEIGHNLPPPEAIDSMVLEEGALAAQVAADQVVSPDPDANVLQLCLSALRRVGRILRQIAKWAMEKGDRFINAALDSAGKAVGPAIIVSTTIAQIHGELDHVIEIIRKALGV